MKYIGLVWIIVLVINIVFLLINMKLKTNAKFLVASLLLVVINYSSKFVFYLFTGEYLEIVSVMAAYLTEFVFAFPMIVGLVVLMINIKKKYALSSMICSDIIALNLSFLTFRYMFLMADNVNYILRLLVQIYLVSILFLIILVGKWIYIYVVGRKKKHYL